MVPRTVCVSTHQTPHRQFILIHDNSATICVHTNELSHMLKASGVLINIMHGVHLDIRWIVIWLCSFLLAEKLYKKENPASAQEKASVGRALGIEQPEKMCVRKQRLPLLVSSRTEFSPVQIVEGISSYASVAELLPFSNFARNGNAALSCRAYPVQAKPRSYSSSILHRSLYSYSLSGTLPTSWSALTSMTYL